jgi:hypothetical protein
MRELANDKLIDRLAADATPVKRLRPPLLRAGVWLGTYCALIAGAVWVFGATPAAAAEEPRALLESAAIVFTGVSAVIAAFFLSLPDRSRLWLAAPVVPLVLWLALSGYGCWLRWLEGDGGSLAQSVDCLVFILGLGIPSAAALYASLRRAQPLDVVPVLVAGGLGVAGLTAGALQFFHPFDVTFLDLGVHIAAMSLVVALMTIYGSLRLSRRPA